MSVPRNITAVLASVAVIAASLVASGGVRLAAADPPELRFTAAGDYSTTPNTFAVLSQIGTLAPDLHLALGDLSYSNSVDEQGWCDLVTARAGAGFPFELIAGNHESNGMNGSINNFSSCLPNQLPGLIGTYGRQYYVDVPAEAPLVRYIMVSPALDFPDGTTWSYAAGTPRYAWTASAIDGAHAANIPWVVVGMHKPCLSIGAYNCDPGADFINMLVTKKVDVVLSGHEHFYHRSHQLASSAGCPALVPGTFTAACIADADATMTKGAGIVFATVGTGGVPLRDANPADSEAGYIAAYSAANANPTWGVLQFRATADTLSVDFMRAAGGTFADTFTLGPPTTPSNQSPVASFTASCTLLACSTDATASSDPDGTIASYAWAFGDSSTASGVTASHSYAAAGSYTITLTVTDNLGATASTTRVVLPTAPPGNELARDDFTRSVASGWGTATLGGNWSIVGTASALSVSANSGKVTLPAGSTRTSTLPAVSTTTSDSTVTFALDRVPAGGGLYATLVGRQVGTGFYAANAWVKSTGAISLVLKQGATALSVTAIGGPAYVAGQEMRMRLQTFGTAPTTIRAKIWPASQAEPAAWAASTVDTTAALQAAGTVGIQTYLSSTAGAAVVTSYDGYLVAVAP